MRVNILSFLELTFIKVERRSYITYSLCLNAREIAADYPVIVLYLLTPPFLLHNPL